MIGSLVAYSLVASVDRNPKIVSEAELKSKLRFKTSLPGAEVAYKVHARRIVWIPKLSEFPDFSARQAVRFTLISPKGEVVELIQAPTQPSASTERHVWHIWSQGYTGLSAKIGWGIIPHQIGQTDIAVYGETINDRRSDFFVAISDSLDRLAKIL